MEFFASVKQAAEAAINASDDGTLAAMVNGGGAVSDLTAAPHPTSANGSGAGSALANKSPDELRALVAKLVKVNKGSHHFEELEISFK